jgi:hypothetical protein
MPCIVSSGALSKVYGRQTLSDSAGKVFTGSNTPVGWVTAFTAKVGTANPLPPCKECFQHPRS